MLEELSNNPHGPWLRVVGLAAAATFGLKRETALLAVAVAVARRADPVTALAAVQWNEIAAEIKRSRDSVGEYLAWMVNNGYLLRLRPIGYGPARTGQYALKTPGGTL
jgi:hypothetical protein